jgi:hypothetical protein
MYAIAAQHFDEALRVAGAAGDAQIQNLARIGLGRALLNRGQNTQAIQTLTAVPSTFTAWLNYVPDASLSGWQMYNFLDWWAGDKAGELDLAYETTFALQDRRIPRRTALETMSDGRRQGFRPMQTSSYSGWKVDGPGELFDEATGVRIASYLEARYMIAEASLAGGTGGLANAAIVTFINERRAVGGQTNYTGGSTTAELRSELLEQRKRDFYLAGYRVGDLRRYKRLYQTDLWPKGVMPGLTRPYGGDECWPMDSNELNGNPNAR